MITDEVFSDDFIREAEKIQDLLTPEVGIWCRADGELYIISDWLQSSKEIQLCKPGTSLGWYDGGDIILLPSLEWLVTYDDGCHLYELKRGRDGSPESNVFYDASYYDGVCVKGDRADTPSLACIRALNKILGR